MSFPRKIIFFLILAALPFGSFHPFSEAQGLDDPDFRDFFGIPVEPGEAEPPPPAEEILEPSPEPAPPTGPESKTLVPLPEPWEKEFTDAGDFRDPFFLVRGFQEDAQNVLTPGVTIDGIRFKSYKQSDRFVEKYYKESQYTRDGVFGKVVHLEHRLGCLRCHRGIEEISENHRFPCTRCHRGNQRAKTLPDAHKGLVTNPSDLDHAARFCGKCHADQIAKIERSVMTTARGIINATRYAWGAQPLDAPQVSLRPQENEAPFPPPGEPHAADDLLKTKCLRCHIQGPAPRRPGDYRSTGCAACHMIYNNDGLTLSRDRVVQKGQRRELKKHPGRFSRGFAARSLNNRRGYPVMHKFTVAVPSVQCEHCHNNNGVGNEFEGLFGKPARPRPAPRTLGNDQPVLYGKEHEFLLPDIHRERGMHCIDCHGGSEIKPTLADPAQPPAEKIQCVDCHGTPSKGPEKLLLVATGASSEEILKRNKLNPNLVKKVRVGDTILVTTNGIPMPHIKWKKKNWVLISKVTGKKHVIPLLKDLKKPGAHAPKKHMESLECAACHARWSASDWGLHLIREARPNLETWRNWSFSDPSLQHLLTRGGEAENPPGMLDWLSAQSLPTGIEGNRIPGVWWDVLTEGGWSDLILGKNLKGKYTVLKPRYQYFFTDRPDPDAPARHRAQLPITADGRPGLIMMEHTPHTIRKSVRPCESCHESTLNAGLGDRTLKTVQDAREFLEEVKTKNRILPHFQIRQMITPAGEAVQTPYPPGEVRFLNVEEIAALEKRDARYRAHRYLDLRRLRFPRFLARDEFPYDIKHQQNEQRFGPPPRREEDLFYDLDHNEFVGPESVEKNNAVPVFPGKEKDFETGVGDSEMPEPGETASPIREFPPNLLKENLRPERNADEPYFPR